MSQLGQGGFEVFGNGGRGTVDVPHLCLSSEMKFPVDSNQSRINCSQCGSTEIAPTFRLDGKGVPYSNQGTFARGALLSSERLAGDG
jgi:predicted RNA-binding Zn-ribbon protein involved in translation (DUF1610 family)